jgi:RNA-directed DNA polymerase
MRQVIRRNRGYSQADLIRQLNPMIRGWAYYHRHVAAKRTFKKVDWALWHSLWRWAKYRHSGKGSRWVIQRYWHPIGGRMVFAADTGKRTPDGKIIWFRLVNPVAISIRRHLRIRGDANPFDLSWRAYFEDRAFFKKFGIHRRKAGLKPTSKPAPP